MTLKLPKTLYIQTEDENGEPITSVDDIETYSWDRINNSDAVYYRAGKTIPDHFEIIDDLKMELARATTMISVLERATDKAAVMWEDGKPMSIMWYDED